VQITGNYDYAGAQALATVLESGSLPVSFEYSQSQVVGPTLGQDALRSGVLAALIGMLLVMIYLLFFYKGLGTIAAGAVVVFAIFYLGILATLSAFDQFSLTLSGVAGIVLTIGMAADSSVLTIERFREEIRMGRSIRAASITGVRHAIMTSIDADLVSLVSALSLFFLASASVKGFGLTLALGIICDIIMMLLFKAPLVRLLAPHAIEKNPGFWNVKDGQIAAAKFGELGAILGVPAGEAEIGEALDKTEIDRIAKQRAGEEGSAIVEAVHNLKGRFIKHDFNFMGKRRIFLTIAAVCVVAALGIVGFKGLTFGIEFVGGTSIAFHDTGDIAIEDMRAALAEAGEPDATVQTTTTDGEEGFLVRMTTTDAQESAATAAAVGEKFGLTTDNYEVQTIGPDWGSSVVNQSLLAFIVSIVLIIIYIAIRFEFKMGVTAVVTLLHDLIIVIGIYALVGREFTPNAVAALLTILGYSLYDKVVVFHRISDNAKDLNIKCTFMTMANHSANQVLMRSINTSLTSLIPVLAMLLFGGETLKDFAFAMTIGLIIGCYSSITVATPLFAMWKTRESRYAKLAKKYGDAIGVFEFERSGATVAGSLGTSKQARLKTARAQAILAEQALAANAPEDAAGAPIADEAGTSAPVVEAAAEPLPNPRNPKKAKRKRKR
jgi:SecD/SecF fusion protein